MITRFVSVSVIYVMSIIILFQILFLPFKFITIDSLLSIEWNLCFVEKPLLSKWQFVYFLSLSSCKLSVLEIFMKKITTIRKLISSMIYCIDTTWLINSFTHDNNSQMYNSLHKIHNPFVLYLYNASLIWINDWQQYIYREWTCNLSKHTRGVIAYIMQKTNWHFALWTFH